MKNFIPALCFLLCLLASTSVIAQRNAWPTDILRDTFRITKPDQIDHALDSIYQGCARRDCIPSIDQPNFVSAREAAGIEDDDLVIGLVYGETQRAYPAFILNHHEVVNDVVDGEPIAITFCPLCGSGVAFERTVGGKTTELGVSGLLHNSDLILYDRNSQTLWQQITGQAIAGPRRGEELKSVPVVMTTWKTWREAHPQSELLSHDGTVRLAYPQKQPYGDYETSDQLMFPARGGGGITLHPKQVVHGLRVDNQAYAVTQRALDAESPVKIVHDGMMLVWTQLADGQVVVIENEAGNSYSPKRMFWFAWYSFNPDTLLRDQR